jgi:hypothetical protein
MEKLERQKTFTFKGEKVTVQFPNVGQMIDMESLKQSLTGNKYGSMSASGVKSMFFALDMVDALCFFEIMCPKIKRIMEIKNFTTLNPEDMKDVVAVYKEHVAPWYNKMLADLYEVGNDDGKAKETNSDEEAE